MSPADEPLAKGPEDPVPNSASEARSDDSPVVAETSAIAGDDAAREEVGARSPESAATTTPPKTTKKRKTTARGGSKRKKKSARSTTAKADSRRSAATEESAVSPRGDNGAFPFLGDTTSNDAVDVDLAGHDETIAGLADEEWMRTMEHDGATAVAEAVAEAAAAARFDAAGSAVHQASEATTSPATKGVRSLRTRIATWLLWSRGVLGAGGARAAVRRVVLAAGLAIAAGLGYGAAVRLFFDDAEHGLSANSGSDPSLGSPPSIDRTPGLAEASHTEPPAGDVPQSKGESQADPAGRAFASPDLASAANDPAPATDPAAEPVASPSTDELEGATSDVTSAVAVPEMTAEDPTQGATVRTETRIVGPEKPFAMPELSTSLPRKNHPLTNGRERLDRGDLEAARRTATDFLLREDGLSAEDRLFVAQAYALLADCLKIELDRNRADAKRATSQEERPSSRPLPVGTEEGR